MAGWGQAMPGWSLRGRFQAREGVWWACFEAIWAFRHGIGELDGARTVLATAPPQLLASEPEGGPRPAEERSNSAATSHMQPKRPASAPATFRCIAPASGGTQLGCFHSSVRSYFWPCRSVVRGGAFPVAPRVLRPREGPEGRGEGRAERCHRQGRRHLRDDHWLRRSMRPRSRFAQLIAARFGASRM